MLELALGLAALLGGLAVAAYLEARALSSLCRSLIRSMDRSARRVGAFALAPGLAATTWIIHRGVAPPGALIVGCAIAMGVFSIALAILKSEGLIAEPHSAAMARIAAGRAPSSTLRGRVIATTVGIALLGVGFLALHAVS